MSETRRRHSELIKLMMKAHKDAGRTATGTPSQRNHYRWAHVLAVVQGTYCFEHDGNPGWLDHKMTDYKNCTRCGRMERIP